ncbi:hypothetical protein BB558_004339 [Smittium angustum]|uniref:Nuclear pore complex protein Nup205 n=1 Tax=Smittium angustum TaxID=133377 RepID=A0A2U1J3J2_SMIAN|nr:hypothetical protein BB558_004339 [Smittium angustum]
MSLLWSVDQFSKLDRLILNSFDVSEDNSEFTLRELVPALDDATKLIARLFLFPPPNSLHLAQLEKGNIKIDGQDFSVNSEFIEETKKVSSFLQIDELLAATMVHNGMAYGARLERPIAECALLLFYSERQKLLMCLDSIFSGGVNTTLPENIRSAFQNTAELLLSSTLEKTTDGSSQINFNINETKTEEMFPERILQTIKNNNEFAEKIKSKISTLDSKFGEDVVNEVANSLQEERRLLSIIFFVIVSKYQLNSHELTSLVTYMKQADISDELTLRLIPSILYSLDTSFNVNLDSELIEANAFDKASLLASDPKFLQKLDAMISSNDWKAPQLKAVVLLQWSLTVIYGIKRVPGFADSIGYQEDKAESLVEEAMRMDCFVFAKNYLLSYKQPELAENSLDQNKVSSGPESLSNQLSNPTINPTSSSHPSNTTSPKSSFYRFELEEAFQKTLEDCLDNLVFTFIIRSSNVIRRIRYSEEDEILKYQQKQILEHQAEQQQAIQQWYGASRLQTPRSTIKPEYESKIVAKEPHRSTEALFKFISVLFKNRLDSGIRFWAPGETGFSEIDDRLVVFIRWGADMREQGMIEAYLQMLASLAYGPQASIFAHEFMITGGGRLLEYNRSNSKLPLCSWDSLFSALDFYEQILQQTKADPLAVAPEIPIAEIKVIEAFLELLKQVVLNSLSARMSLYENSKLQVMWTLFSLLGCAVPVSTKAKLLETIAAFSSQTPASLAGSGNDNQLEEFQIINQISKKTWQLLEQSQALATATGSSGTNIGQWGWQTRGGIVYELEEIEAAMGYFPETRAFIGLLNSLVRLYSGSVPLSDMERDPVLFSTHSPSVPADLGKEYRIPGITPYVTFVLDNVLGKSNQRVYNNSWEKWVIISSSLELIERCLATMVLPLAQGKFTVEDYQLLITHPGFEICIRVLCGADLIHSLYGVLCEGVDSVNSEEGSVGNLKSNSVLFAMRIFYKILRVQDTILNIVVPELLESNPRDLFELPLNIPRSLTTLDSLLLLKTDVVIQIASYINSVKSPSLCEASVKLVHLFSHSQQFSGSDNDMQLSSGNFKLVTANRLVQILETSSESNRIMHGYISRLEQDDGDFMESVLEDNLEESPKNLNNESVYGYSNGLGDKLTSGSTSAVRLSIMNLLISNLESDSPSPTIAHWLLGFNLQNLSREELSEPTNKLSCLHVVLSMLNQGASADGDSSRIGEQLIYLRPRMAESCYKLIYILATNSVTSGVFLRYLRKNDDFVLIQLKSISPKVITGVNSEIRNHILELLRGTSVENTIINLPQLNPVRVFYQFFSYSWFLQYVSHELHLASLSGNRSRVQQITGLLLKHAPVPGEYSNINDSDNVFYRKGFGSVDNSSYLQSLFMSMRNAYSDCLILIDLRRKIISKMLTSNQQAVKPTSDDLNALAQQLGADLNSVLVSSSHGCVTYDLHTLSALCRNADITSQFYQNDSEFAQDTRVLISNCFFINQERELFHAYSQARLGWCQIAQIVTGSSWQYISEAEVMKQSIPGKAQLCIDMMNTLSNEFIGNAPPLPLVLQNSSGNALESELGELVGIEEETHAMEMSTLLSSVFVSYSEKLGQELAKLNQPPLNIKKISTGSSINGGLSLEFPLEPIVQTWKNTISSSLSEDSKASMEMRTNLYASLLHFLSGISAFCSSSDETNLLETKSAPGFAGAFGKGFETPLSVKSTISALNTPLTINRDFDTSKGSDGQRKNQKLIQRVLEALTGSSVGEQLLEMLCVDALDGTDACKAVSFSLLNTLTSLYSTEPRSRLVPFLSRHNFIGQFIDMLRRLDSSLVSVLSSTSNSTNALYIYESMMSFFLRLSHRRVGAERLLEGGILEALSNSEYINCRPQKSGDNNWEHTGDDIENRLERYTQLFLPVMNLLATLLAKIGKDNIPTLHRVLRFVTLHYMPLEQIMKETSVSGSFLSKRQLSEVKAISLLLFLLSRHQSVVEKSFSDANSGILSLYNLHIPAVRLLSRLAGSSDWKMRLNPVSEDEKILAATPSLLLASLNSMEKSGSFGVSSLGKPEVYSNEFGEGTDMVSGSLFVQQCMFIVQSIVSNVTLYAYSISLPLMGIEGNPEIRPLGRFRPTLAWPIDHCRETDQFPSLATVVMLSKKVGLNIVKYQELYKSSTRSIQEINNISTVELKRLAASTIPLINNGSGMNLNQINTATNRTETVFSELPSDLSVVQLRGLAEVALNRMKKEADLQLSLLLLTLEQSLLLLYSHLQHYYASANLDYPRNMYDDRHMYANDQGYQNDRFDTESNTASYMMGGGFPSSLINPSIQNIESLRSDASIILPSLLNFLDSINLNKDDFVVQGNSISTNGTKTSSSRDVLLGSEKKTGGPGGDSRLSFVKMMIRRIKTLLFSDD